MLAGQRGQRGRGSGEAGVDEGGVQGGEGHRAGPHRLRGCSSSLRRASRPLSKPRRPGGPAPPDSGSSRGGTPRSALSQRQPPTPTPHTGPTCRAAPGQLAQGSEGRAQVTRIPSSLDRMSPALVAKATAPRTTPASRRPLSPWSRQAGPVTPPPRPSHRGRSRGGWLLARPRGHLLSPGAATVPCWLVLGAGLVLVLSPGYVQEGPGAS